MLCVILQKLRKDDAGEEKVMAYYWLPGIVDIDSIVMELVTAGLKFANKTGWNGLAVMQW